MAAVLKDQYGVNLSVEGLKRLSESLPPTEASNPKKLFDQLLQANIADEEHDEKLTAPGGLQRDIGSQPTLSVKGLTFVQIDQSRDVTQPLRACSDTVDSDELWATSQNLNLKTRLLKLIVTDGHVHVPAIELSTLKTFRSVPIPGEKLILKDFEVKNGMIILTDECIHFYGGGVDELKKELFMLRDRRNRLAGMGGGKGGLEGAPKFEQFHAQAGFDKRPKIIDALAGRPQFAAAPVSSGSRGGSGGGDRGRSDAQPQGNEHGARHHFAHGHHGRGGGKDHHPHSHSHSHGHNGGHSHHGHGHGHSHSHSHSHGHGGRAHGGRGHEGRGRGGGGHQPQHRDPMGSQGGYDRPAQREPYKPSTKTYDDDWPELN